MRCENSCLLCVVKAAVEAKLIAQLSDLVGELVERSECVLNLCVCKTRVGEVVDKLLVLSFKLRKSRLCGFSILGTAVIEPVELVYCLVDRVLQLGEHAVDLVVYKRKILLCVFDIYYLL